MIPMSYIFSLLYDTPQNAWKRVGGLLRRLAKQPTNLNPPEKQL